VNNKRGIAVRGITGFIFVLIIIAAVSCSSRKKYGDIREFIKEVSATQEEFLSKIDKSSNADDVVLALDTFSDKLIKLSEKSMEIKKRYPEWVNEPPAEIKTDLEKLDSPVSEFEKVFIKEKIKILIKDKKVQSAVREFNNKMDMVKFF